MSRFPFFHISPIPSYYTYYWDEQECAYIQMIPLRYEEVSTGDMKIWKFYFTHKKKMSRLNFPQDKRVQSVFLNISWIKNYNNATDKEILST